MIVVCVWLGKRSQESEADESSRLEEVSKNRNLQRPEWVGGRVEGSDDDSSGAA